VVLTTILLTSTNEAQAVGTFIPAPSRFDMVYDSNRDVLYISSGGSILRYHIGSNTFLTPFVTGGNLGGIDISPDGNTLVVADRRRLETLVWVYVVDLQTEQITQLQFPRGFFEGGTFTVAFANDGLVLSTSLFEGSGWVPLRKFNPLTGDWSQVDEVRQDTMITASGNMGIIGFAEANISDGRFGLYRVADGNVVRKTFQDGTGWFNYEIGVNRNGTQYAIPTFGGTFIADVNLNKFHVIGQQGGNHPIGVVYHPVENIVYFAWVDTTQIRAFDTSSFAQIAAHDFEFTFTNPGNDAFVHGRLKTSRDGSLLFATVGGGVRYLRLYAPLRADSQSVSTNEDTPVPITLTGSVGNGGGISYVITSNPSHGTLSGVAPNLIYTPDTNYFGPDSFTFKTVYGAASSSEATVSLTINASGGPPIARADTATTTRNTTVSVPVLANDSDPDGDPLTITAVTQGANGGTVTITNGGTRVSFRPRSGFTGTDSFTYTVSDGDGGTATATVTVTVTKK
jgi:hypothetical protein